jgi:hypothetical protein
MNINGIDTTNIVKINGISKASISKLNGISLPSVGAAITLTDITTTCELNKTYNVDPLNVTLPATAGSGDFVIVFVAVDQINDTEFWLVPSGWTRAYSRPSGLADAHISMFYRLFDGTEGVTVDITGSTANTGRDAAGISLIANNIDTTNPIHVTGSSAASGDVTTLAIPGVAYTVDGMAIGAMAHDGGDGDPYTYSSGWGNVKQGECGGGGADLGYAICSQSFTGTGNTGTLGVTGSVADGKVGVQVFLKQA